MSFKKRRSETGQIRREDYDAYAERLDNNEQEHKDDNDNNASQMLSPEELRQTNRRIVRASRPKNTENIQLPEAPRASTSLNPFANISLGGSSTVPTFSWKPKAAEPAAIAYHRNLVLSQSKAYRGLFTKIRDVQTSSREFVHYAQRAMRLLAEDALAEIPGTAVTIVTPCHQSYRGVQRIVSEDLICAVSIVRSGDCLLESVRQVEPGCRVGKILIQRDESHPDKAPKLFYSKLPLGVEQMYILLCDPMLATGGSAVMALNVLVQDYKVDPSKIIFCNMICAPEGLRRLHQEYPQVKIVTACIDEGLNEQKFIVPGLGDYGDRFFNTMEE